MDTYIRAIHVKFFSIILLIASTIATGCDPCLGEGWSCADQFKLSLVDKKTHKDLVFGNNPAYSRDSVYLTVHLAGYLGNMSIPEANKFIYMESVNSG